MPRRAQPRQSDIDRDGVGEACQAFFRDADGDSLPDYLDSCRYPDEELPEGAAFVPCDELGRRDSDGDGVANDDDICWRVPNPRQDPACLADLDGDGVPNDRDNCLELPNPDQVEAAPGLGAACAIPL
ncbi:MAG: thrombospondin type 3 repeat-containing protein [bacterium]